MFSFCFTECWIIFLQITKSLKNALFSGIKTLLTTAIVLSSSLAATALNAVLGSVSGLLNSIAGALQYVSDDLKISMGELSPSTYDLYQDC